MLGIALCMQRGVMVGVEDKVGDATGVAGRMGRLSLFIGLGFGDGWVSFSEIRSREPRIKKGRSLRMFSLDSKSLWDGMSMVFRLVL